MGTRKYIVTLTSEERKNLTRLVSAGQDKAYRIKHANILLAADENGPNLPSQEIRTLLDVDYPQAEKVILICDNLNTHKIASLYETFLPQEAKRLRDRLEIHYTPKHGSWLNVAEIELSLLTRQCLDRRLPDIPALQRQAEAWYEKRNAKQKSVDWQFTSVDARIKLKSLYPQFKR